MTREKNATDMIARNTKNIQKQEIQAQWQQQELAVLYAQLPRRDGRKQSVQDVEQCSSKKYSHVRNHNEKQFTPLKFEAAEAGVNKIHETQQNMLKTTLIILKSVY